MQNLNIFPGHKVRFIAMIEKLKKVINLTRLGTNTNTNYETNNNNNYHQYKNGYSNNNPSKKSSNNNIAKRKSASNIRSINPRTSGNQTLSSNNQNNRRLSSNLINDKNKQVINSNNNNNNAYFPSYMYKTANLNYSKKPKTMEAKKRKILNSNSNKNVFNYNNILKQNEEGFGLNYFLNINKDNLTNYKDNSKNILASQFQPSPSFDINETTNLINSKINNDIILPNYNGKAITNNNNLYAFDSNKFYYENNKNTNNELIKNNKIINANNNIVVNCSNNNNNNNKLSSNKKSSSGKITNNNKMTNSESNQNLNVLNNEDINNFSNLSNKETIVKEKEENNENNENINQIDKLLKYYMKQLNNNLDQSYYDYDYKDEDSSLENSHAYKNKNDKDNILKESIKNNDKNNKNKDSNKAIMSKIMFVNNNNTNNDNIKNVNNKQEKESILNNISSKDIINNNGLKDIDDEYSDFNNDGNIIKESCISNNNENKDKNIIDNDTLINKSIISKTKELHESNDVLLIDSNIANNKPNRNENKTVSNANLVTTVKTKDTKDNMDLIKNDKKEEIDIEESLIEDIAVINSHKENDILIKSNEEINDINSNNNISIKCKNEAEEKSNNKTSMVSTNKSVNKLNKNNYIDNTNVTNSVKSCKDSKLNEDKDKCILPKTDINSNKVDNDELEEIDYMRIVKSFEEVEEFRQNVDQFDLEYMSRCLGIALMKHIENGKERVHICDVLNEDNEKFMFFNSIYNKNFEFFNNFFEFYNDSKEFDAVKASNLQRLDINKNNNNTISKNNNKNKNNEEELNNLLNNNSLDYYDNVYSKVKEDFKNNEKNDIINLGISSYEYPIIKNDKILDDNKINKNVETNVSYFGHMKFNEKEIDKKFPPKTDLPKINTLNNNNNSNNSNKNANSKNILSNYSSKSKLGSLKHSSEDLFDLDKELKAINDYFAHNKAEKYKNLSTTTKNIMLKNLEMIHEIDSVKYCKDQLLMSIKQKCYKGNLLFNKNNKTNEQNELIYKKSPHTTNSKKSKLNEAILESNNEEKLIEDNNANKLIDIMQESICEFLEVDNIDKENKEDNLNKHTEKYYNTNCDNNNNNNIDNLINEDNNNNKSSKTKENIDKFNNLNNIEEDKNKLNTSKSSNNNINNEAIYSNKDKDTIPENLSFSPIEQNNIDNSNTEALNMQFESGMLESNYIIDIQNSEKLKEFLLNNAEIYDDDYEYKYNKIINKKFASPPDPSIIFEFCANVMIMTKMEKEVIIISLIYLERFIFNTGILINSRNWKRLLFTSMIMASKIWDDDSFENNHYAQVFSHLSIGEINLLERTFLELINYKVYVKCSEYFKYFFIIKAIALKFNFDGLTLVPISITKMMKLQEYAYQNQKKLRKKYTSLNNSTHN